MLKDVAKPEWRWRGFGDNRLAPRDKELIRAQLVPTTEAFNVLCGWAMGGYKVTLSYDGPHDTYVVSVTSKDCADPNSGLTLSTRHTDPAVGVSALVYLISERYENGAWKVYGDQKDDAW